MKEILLVDDHAMIRTAIKQYLRSSKKFKVVDEAENGKQALELLSKRSYDFIITDLSMPELDGMGLIKKIKASFPNQLVIALSMDYDTHTIKKLEASGIRGYLFKNVVKEDFIKALTVITLGGKYYSDVPVKKESIFSLQRHYKDLKAMPTKKKLIASGRLVIEGASILYL